MDSKIGTERMKHAFDALFDKTGKYAHKITKTGRGRFDMIRGRFWSAIPQNPKKSTVAAELADLGFNVIYFPANNSKTLPSYWGIRLPNKEIRVLGCAYEYEVRWDWEIVNECKQHIRDLVAAEKRES